jgi:hypothetical protein
VAGDVARLQLVDSLSNQSWRIRLTVEAIERGLPGDLASFDVPAAKRRHLPFYVRVRVTNRAKRPFAENVEPSTHLTAVDEHGAEAHPLLLVGEFERCDQHAPPRTRPGATYEVCSTYLLAPGNSIARVQWEVASGGDPIVWTP